MDKEKLYKQAIMDHYHNSPHRGELKNPDFTTDQTSPSCGDRIIFDVIIRGNQIVEIKFRGEGSILGQAMASMLCDYALGNSIDAVLKLTQDDVIAFLGIELGPTRLRTVVFILQTLQKGIRNYAQSHQSL